MKSFLIFFSSLSFLLFLSTSPCRGQEEKSGSHDINAFVNLWALFSDNEVDPRRNSVSIRETELAFISHFHPNIEGRLIIAMHEHEGEWEIHPEEAFISFIDLPLGFQFLAGRKLIDFGYLNPVHPHHWKFAATPIAINNLFGDHPLFDDGAQIMWIPPDPWDIDIGFAFGHWTGESPEHEHDHASHTVRWQGKTYNARADVDVPLGEHSSIRLGYSTIWDEGNHTNLHGGDLLLMLGFPNDHRRLEWQSELFHATTEDEYVPDLMGAYSMLSLTWTEHWEFGARYDWSEFFYEEEFPLRDSESGITCFITRYFAHTFYLRGEYTNSINRFEVEENRFILQAVWGLAPHDHGH
jgi:hypothetical protein